MTFDSSVMIEYINPFLGVLGIGFGIATCLSLLMFGIHKALGLFNV